VNDIRRQIAHQAISRRFANWGLDNEEEAGDHRDHQEETCRNPEQAERAVHQQTSDRFWKIRAGLQRA
jgi:hypothetical protein